MKPLRNPRRECGAVLFIALVFLMLLTVMALTTFNLSKGTQQIVGNMAVRSQAFNVALQTSEAAISTNRLVHHPDDLFGTGSNMKAVDVNGDGKTVISATVATPQCISIQQVVDNKLDLGTERDLECANSAKNNLFCYDVLFEFATRADDPVTQASGTVTQGASVRSQPASARNICRSSSGEPYF
jgi:Tfp pilus assembly protein PilX